MSGWRALRCSTRSTIQPAGVEPTSTCVSDRCLAARPRLDSQRPVRESDPSHLLDRQAVTPASSQGSEQGRKDSNPLRVGLSHTALPGAHPYQAARVGLEPTTVALTGRRTTFCATELNQSGRQDLNLRSRPSRGRGHSGLAHVLLKHPHEESNLVLDLRRVLCAPAHPGDVSTPTRSRTRTSTFEASHDLRFTTGVGTQ
jgi:hypothetical protein